MLLSNESLSPKQQRRVAWTFAAHVFELVVIVSAFFIVLFINEQRSHWLRIHNTFMLIGVVVMRGRVDEARLQRLQSFTVVVWLWLLWLGIVVEYKQTDLMPFWVGLLFGAVLLAIAFGSPWIPARFSRLYHDIGSLMLVLFIAVPTTTHATIDSRPLSGALRIVVVYIMFNTLFYLDHDRIVDTRCLLVRVGWLFVVPPFAMTVAIVVLLNGLIASSRNARRAQPSMHLPRTQSPPPTQQAKSSTAQQSSDVRTQSTYRRPSAPSTMTVSREEIESLANEPEYIRRALRSILAVQGITPADGPALATD